jgi:hypothetical protein
MTLGTVPLQTGLRADLGVERTRFHVLTERTRNSFACMHVMRFVLTLRDSAAGQVLDGPREVVADIKASGGAGGLGGDG